LFHDITVLKLLLSIYLDEGVAILVKSPCLPILSPRTSADGRVTVPPVGVVVLPTKGLGTAGAITILDTTLGVCWEPSHSAGPGTRIVVLGAEVVGVNGGMAPAAATFHALLLV
jgi:hypothetical protein